MARCPFAVWRPISGSSGPHLGGPFKIVHHTTEGSTAQGAMSAFQQNRSDPHFTVDATAIFQHIDTAEGARSLRNEPGGVQTNRDSAVQIELVGFAQAPKDRGALANVARVCRWIEATHGVPKVWPSGPPKPARNGRDPGGHNRDALTWDTKGGHYGHCHVPENTHWDPGYTAEEVTFLMDASFDADGRLLDPSLSPLSVRARKVPQRTVSSTMPDHPIVPRGVGAYISDLPLSPPPLPAVSARRKPSAKTSARPVQRRSSAKARSDVATIDVGSLLAFVDGISESDRQDVLYSVQLAQRAASGAFDRFTQTQFWYQKYVEVLQNLGWTNEQFAFSRFDQDEGEFRMDQTALGSLFAIATQNQLAVLQQSIDALSKLADDDKRITLFDFHASTQTSGNFQLGAVQRSANGALSVALGAFYFQSLDERRRFLFVRWGSRDIHFWSAAQRMTLNTDFYARRRNDVIAKLEADASAYIADLKLGSR